MHSSLILRLFLHLEVKGKKTVKSKLISQKWSIFIYHQNGGTRSIKRENSTENERVGMHVGQMSTILMEAQWKTILAMGKNSTIHKECHRFSSWHVKLRRANSSNYIK